MGREKALLEFTGQPLVVRALTILRNAGLQASIAGARSTLSAFAPVVEDAGFAQGKGPLSGVCAALDATPARFAVFLPVDVPFIPSSLIAYLLFHSRIAKSLITIASVSGFPQTFPAVIDRRALPLLRQRLMSEERGCLNAFQHAATSLAEPISVLSAELLVQSGQVSHPASLPSPFWFLNLNAPRDLMRAQALAAGNFRVS
jgi:molybdopterin-guanine dinucleotide biosynthesis protein A